MRRFYLQRDEDKSGTGGEGRVADGVAFEDGKVALRWRTTPTSTAVYERIEDVGAIHGHGGKTYVVWID